MTVGEALLSPTRLYAPIAMKGLDKVGGGVHGMVHNTGGGQTKCMRLGSGVRYVKDGLPDPDPVFKLIQREGGVEWHEMYQDFNMGVGYEFMVAPESAEDVLSICEGYGIGAMVIGRCEKTTQGNTLEIYSEYGSFKYSSIA
jgi:phosphoribosylformylglycinamidine cyclo-ligase